MEEAMETLTGPLRGLWVHRPLLGDHGTKMVVFACAYEIVALIPGSPLPSITEISQTHFKPLGLIMALVGLHHFYVEDPRYLQVPLIAMAPPRS